VRLLALVDELRQLGVGRDARIPQIAVCGDQSSGTSSVLEALSGIPFPRGLGLVTRYPTVISMRRSDKEWVADISISMTTTTKTQSSHAQLQELAGGVEYEYEGTGRVFSAQELSSRIKQLTEQLISHDGNGNGNGNEGNNFSDCAINISVCARDLPDLCLVDLPGIIRATTAGQGASAISQVDEMIKRFMVMPETIILAVIPCNQDIATVDVLERAAAFDVMGSRTIGVLTKPDLLDA